MKAFYYLILLLLSFQAWGKQALNVGVAEWDGYTNLDGTGVYNELIKEVFSDHQINLSFDSYTRNVHYFERGELDMLLGVFREDIKEGHFPRWYLDMEYPITAFFNKSKHQVSNPLQLENMVLSWVRGYNFEKYIDVAHQSYLLNSPKLGFELVAKKRIDAFIDYDYNLPEKYRPLLGAFELIGKRKIYVVFADTPKGKQLAKTYDQKMAALRSSGKLKKLLNKAHEQGYSHAEFETFNPNKQHIIVRTRDISLLKSAKLEPFDSLEGKTLKTIFTAMSNTDIETAKYDSFNTDVERYGDSENTCIANKAKNEERLKHFIFSEPFVMYPGLRLYSKKPLKTKQQKVSLLEVFKQHPALKLGYVEGQHYTAQINATFALLPSKNLVQTVPDFLTQLRMLDGKDTDLIIEYPSVIKEYWPYVSKQPLIGYELEGATDFTVGHLMCSNSVANREFISRFNQALKTIKQTEQFLDFHRTSSGITDKEITLLYKQAFKLPL